jgi:hypothetical protein
MLRNPRVDFERDGERTAAVFQRNNRLLAFAD